VSDQPVDNKRPVNVRHATIGSALGEAEESSFDLCRRRLALGGAVEPFDKCIMGFKIRLHARRRTGIL
jgi:hypothetical protein